MTNFDILKVMVGNTITDYSQFDSDRCSNGGCYSFSETLCYDEAKMRYYVLYSTSADFQYCSMSGTFCRNDCNRCDQRPSYMTILQAWEWVIKKFKQMDVNEYLHLEYGEYRRGDGMKKEPQATRHSGLEPWESWEDWEDMLDCEEWESSQSKKDPT